MTEQKNSVSDICTASARDRRECPVVVPSYTLCVKCPYADIRVNLGKPGLRGGTETLADLIKWRKIKSRLGIPHGDGE